MDLMNQIQPPGAAPRAHPERSDSPLPEGMQRALDAAIAQMRHAIAERDRRLEMTCEDSYATRLEHHDAISMLHHILHGMTHPNCNRINLGIVIEDWGYDPEDAASDRDCGLEYASNTECQASLHQAVVNQFASTIENLRIAGFIVNTRTRLVDPSDAIDDDA